MFFFVGDAQQVGATGGEGDKMMTTVCTYSYSIILSTTGDHMVFGELYDAIGSWL